MANIIKIDHKELIETVQRKLKKATEEKEKQKSTGNLSNTLYYTGRKTAFEEVLQLLT